MENNYLLKRLFDGHFDSGATYDGRMSHQYTIFDKSSLRPIGGAATMDAAIATREMLRTSFGGSFDIIETDTITREEHHLFSGEIPQDTPHVQIYDPIDDPMTVEVGVWDASWLIELVAENQMQGIETAAPTNDKPPSPPKTIIRKPQKIRSVTVERVFSGISDPEILADHGYIVIDVRNQERLFCGTKNLCIEYIKSRNVAYGKDKLPISCIKIVKYSDYAKYQANIEKNGVVLRYRGNKIAVGLPAEVKKAGADILPKSINAKHVSVSSASAVDLWWVQNRYDEMRKVAS